MKLIRQYIKKSLITRKFIAGFTLAEVLITLTIIGVIAALTIPSLIQDIQDAQYKIAWKRDYSVMNQAFTRLLSDQGGTLKDLCSTVDWVTDSDCIMKKFKPYLSVQKTCVMFRAMSEGCWHPDDGSSSYLNGSPITALEQPYPGLVLNDGTLMYFSYGNGGCAVNPDGHNNTCVDVSIDVNGFNGPNRFGRDMFRMVVYPTKIKPYGTDNDGYGCTLNPPTGTGYGCSALYLKQ